MLSVGEHNAVAPAAAACPAVCSDSSSGSSSGGNSRGLGHSDGGPSPGGGVPTAMTASTAAAPPDAPMCSLPTAVAATSTEPSDICANDVGGGTGGGALEKLWVKDSDGRSVLFADVSVYTRCVG